MPAAGGHHSRQPAVLSAAGSLQGMQNPVLCWFLSFMHATVHASSFFINSISSFNFLLISSCCSWIILEIKFQSNHHVRHQI
jgi:hypothetical protein